jgi:hypothetical protein
MSAQERVVISDDEAQLARGLWLRGEPVTLRALLENGLDDLPPDTLLRRIAGLEANGVVAAVGMDDVVVLTGRAWIDEEQWALEQRPSLPLQERIAVALQHVCIAAGLLALVEVGVRLGGLWLTLSVCALLAEISLTRGVLVFSDYYAAYSPRKPYGREGILITLGLFVSLTAIFAALTTIRLGLGTVTEAKPIDTPFVLDAFAYYLWNFLDAIPALEVPETLGWSMPAELTDPLSGVLLLAYKVLAIFPLVWILQSFLAARRER